jgi:hypothetical protein
MAKGFLENSLWGCFNFVFRKPVEVLQFYRQVYIVC